VFVKQHASQIDCIQGESDTIQPSPQKKRLIEDATDELNK
jgi:hypothetical protein